MKFTDEESEYLAQNTLGRLATVSPDNQPHVVPIAYEFDGLYLYFSGSNIKNSRKFRDLNWSSKVSFVVDDIDAENPWHARGIEVRGVAEPTETEGYLYIRITPLRKASWGLAEGC